MTSNRAVERFKNDAEMLCQNILVMRGLSERLFADAIPCILVHTAKSAETLVYSFGLALSGVPKVTRLHHDVCAVYECMCAK